ncbi:hypothetical protein AB0O34_18835 [Sphaerisporangium sp. NPDC088356]|uniref:hypothetical protein n=1 Tax=Sphaerisporangium sp. NPDC088356 TaxID=3154871 RepID=UPI0034379969
MGKLIVVENVTLDGVMQAPGGADEDARGGFPHGGWAHPYADHVMAETMGKGRRRQARSSSRTTGRRETRDRESPYLSRSQNPST